MKDVTAAEYKVPRERVHSDQWLKNKWAELLSS